MQILKKSNMTGVEHKRDIPVTLEQLEAWQGGMLIQEAMPNLSADDREFLMSGITPEEWDELFKDDDSEPELRGEEE